MGGLVQVAGVIDSAEAAMLRDCGVDWLGFPLRLPVNREDLSEEQAAAVIRDISPPHRAVLITYETGAEEISAFCRKLGVGAVQLHGRVPVTELQALRGVQPDLYVVKSLVVRGENLCELATYVEESYRWVDMYITDTSDPATGADGATGLAHDWSISGELVRVSPRPVMLAGGLTPDNVAAAIGQVGPAAVDAHTSLEERTGRKEASKVARFVRNAREAFGSSPPA